MFRVRGIFRLVLGLPVALVCLGAQAQAFSPIPADAPGWTIYHSEQDRFSIRLPSSAAVRRSSEPTSAGMINSVVYFIDLDHSRAVTINVTEFGRVPQSAQVVLNAAMDGTANALHSSALQVRPFQIGTSSGVAFAVQTATIDLRARYMLRASKLYSLVFSMPRSVAPGIVDDPESHVILESFRFAP